MDAPHWARVEFEAVAALFLPVDNDPPGVVLRSEHWRPDRVRELTGKRAIVWGRESLRTTWPLVGALRHAIAREVGLRRLRAMRGVRVVKVRRLASRQARFGLVRRLLRPVLVGGAIVEFAKEGGGPTVMGAVAASAGAETIGELLSTTDGRATLKTTIRGAGCVLRVTPSSTAVGTDRTADALQHMNAAGAACVPRLMSTGRVPGAVWIAESLLPGRRPARVTRKLFGEVSRLCSAWPTTPAPDTVASDLELLTRVLPGWASVLERSLGNAASIVSNLPGIAGHGDLGSGNLLSRKGRITGIVDWGTWRPRAVPGTDLLNLFVKATRPGVGMGALWSDRPWRSRRFRDWTGDYWASIGVQPDEELLDAIAVCWWASTIVRMVRLPWRAKDHAWLATHVQPVLRDVSA